MRLKSVFVSQYKNLKNFTLGFDGASFIDVFVGKSGSGWSSKTRIVTTRRWQGRVSRARAGGQMAEERVITL